MGLTDLARRGQTMSLAGTLEDVDGEPRVRGTGFDEPSSGFTGATQFPALGAPEIPPIREGPIPRLISTQQETEESLGDIAARTLGIFGRPVKLVVDAFAHLDRPQQFVFAAITRGLESGSALEAVKSGSSAFLFRRPDGLTRPKDRVDVNEVIDVVGKHFFHTDKASEKMHIVPKFMVQLSGIFLLDPLMWLPWTWASKAGRSISKYAESVRSTYAMQLALTKSPLGNLKSGAAVVNDLRVEKFLKETGRRADGPNVFDMIVEPIRANIGKLDEDEFRMIDDIVTGLGVESAVFRDLAELKKRGIVDEEQVRNVFGRLVNDITQEDAEKFAGLIERAIMQRRQDPRLVKKLILEGTKSPSRGNKPARVISLNDPEGFADPLVRPLMTGQLINRLGLMPSHAVDVRAARALTRAVKKGSDVGPTFPHKAAKEFLKEAKELGPKAAFPAQMSKNFEDAMKAAVGTGRFIVDTTVAARLSQQFETAGQTVEAARRLSRVAAGIEKPFVGTEVPAEIAHREVVNGLMDSDDAGVKALHILSLLMDPKSTMPKPIFNLMKYSEDTAIAHNNLMTDLMHEVLTYKGKVLQEGSYEASLIGVALDNIKTGSAHLQIHKKLKGVTSRQAREMIAKDPELQAIANGIRSFYIGAKHGMIRRGVRGFEELSDKAPLSHYFQRMYPNLREKIRQDLEAGRITRAQAKRAIEAGVDPVSPLEMEFIDRSSVWFSHMKPRTAKAPVDEFSTDVVQAMRTYINGYTRKMFMEPAIATANAASKTLPHTQKTYMKIWLQRLLGYQVGEEEMLNNLINIGRTRIGLAPKIRPATKTSLWITRMFYRGLLGLNTGFFLKNLTQGINTATATGPLNVWRGAAMYVTNPKLPNGKFWREAIGERNLMRNVNDLMERGQWGVALAGKKRKATIIMDKILFSPATASENWNRGTALGAGLSQYMRERGYTSVRKFFTEKPQEFAKAMEYGHAVANETQFIYGMVGRSPIAGSPTGRMALQFFSWPIKQMQFLFGKDNDEGMKFFMRYVAMSGLVSKVAEHAEVDAGAFLGFGFWPSGLSPSAQLIGNLFSAVEAQAVEGDTEASQRHFRDFVRNVETLIPAFLQIQKTVSALSEIEEGVQRGYRERFSRRTDDPAREQELSQLLDISLNPLIQKLHLPWLNKPVSGEQFARLLGLPGIKRNRFTELTRKLNKESRREDKKAARWVDKYVKAYGQGDFVQANQVIQDANADGFPLSASMIKNELANRVTPSMDRILENTRLASRQKLLKTLEDEAPELAAQVQAPVPIDPLGGTR